MTYIKDLYLTETRARADLDRKIIEELKREDPDLETAKAILKDLQSEHANTNNDTTSSKETGT